MPIFLWRIWDTWRESIIVFIVVLLSLLLLLLEDLTVKADPAAASFLPSRYASFLQHTSSPMVDLNPRCVQKSYWVRYSFWIEPLKFVDEGSHFINFCFEAKNAESDWYPIVIYAIFVMFSSHKWRVVNRAMVFLLSSILSQKLIEKIYNLTAESSCSLWLFARLILVFQDHWAG
jgi:hypothetical protein